LAGSLGQLSSGDVLNLLVGTVVSFFVALAAVGWLLRYIARHNFTPFALYRIGFGLLVLAWFTMR